MQAAGYSAARLHWMKAKAIGHALHEFKNAGYSALDLKLSAGCSGKSKLNTLVPSE